MMNQTGIQQFEAILEKHPELDATYISVPFSVPEIYGTKGQVKVKATINNVEFRGLLAAMGTGSHVLGIRKELRNKMGITFGDVVTVKLERDLEPRTVTIPEDLDELLNQEPDLKKRFLKMAYTHQNEYVQHLEDAKKPETRQRRLEKIMRELQNERIRK